MNKKILLLLILTIKISSAICQTENKGLSASLGFGTSFSTSINRDYNVTLSTFLSVGYVLDSNWKVRAEIPIIRFANRSDSTIIVNEIGDAEKITMLALRFDLMWGKFARCGCLQFYLNGGPGIYPIKITRKENNESVSNTEYRFGLGGGGGYSVGLIAKLRLYFEIQYIYIFNDPNLNNYIQLKLGFNYNFF